MMKIEYALLDNSFDEIKLNAHGTRRAPLTSLPIAIAELPPIQTSDRLPLEEALFEFSSLIIQPDGTDDFYCPLIGTAKSLAVFGSNKGEIGPKILRLFDTSPVPLQLFSK